MAQKGKNESLNDRANDAPKRRQRKEPQGAVDCGHSIGILPYLLESGSSTQKPMATDRLAQLRRVFKKEFGYKPTGKTIEELEAILRDQSVSKYGDAEYLFDRM